MRQPYRFVNGLDDDALAELDVGDQPVGRLVGGGVSHQVVARLRRPRLRAVLPVMPGKRGSESTSRAIRSVTGNDRPVSEPCEGLGEVRRLRVVATGPDPALLEVVASAAGIARPDDIEVPDRVAARRDGRQTQVAHARERLRVERRRPRGAARSTRRAAGAYGGGRAPGSCRAARCSPRRRGRYFSRWPWCRSARARSAKRASSVTSAPASPHGAEVLAGVEAEAPRCPRCRPAPRHVTRRAPGRRPRRPGARGRAATSSMRRMSAGCP